MAAFTWNGVDISQWNGVSISEYNGVSVSGGSPTTLLSYDAEGVADGTHLVADGWTGDDTADIAVSTSQYHGGSASILAHLTSTSRTVVHTFTSQTSTFHTSMWIRAPSLGNSTYLGYFGNSSGSAASVYFVAGNGVTVDDGGTPAATGYTFTNITWFHVELEINPSAQTFRIKIDGTEYLSGTTLNFADTISNVDRFEFSTFSSGTVDFYVDDLTVTTGGW